MVYVLRAAGSIATALLFGAALTAPFANSDVPAIDDRMLVSPRAAQRPLYLIAHKVLTTDGVDAALKDGANALEMDMMAWNEGWWCDHDGTRNPPSWYAKTVDQFHHVADARKAGGNIQFVWLDIKDPDYCDMDDPTKEVCSIKALQQMARDILEPAGVKVLYGFSTSKGKAFPYIRDGLNANEAINYDDSNYKTPSEVNNEGLKNVPAGRKVGSYGDDDLAYHFGTCNEKPGDTGARYTCTQLVQARQSGIWGKIFGWTSTIGQSALVEDLFTTAAVDGAIYGSPSDIYSSKMAPAATDIMNWIQKHPNTKKADSKDPPPWSGKA